MKIGDTIYCINESSYSDHITKRKEYGIADLKDGQFRIKNNNGKLVWIPSYCFVDRLIPSISHINIDDEITDSKKDNVEVTIEFDNGEKRWTSFLTCDWLKEKLVNHWDFFIGSNCIFIDNLTKEDIDNAIFQLDKQDQLNSVSMPINEA